MYKIASGFEYEHYGTYLTTRTLKDVSSIAEIALSSGQLWDKTQKDKYMANTITSVMVSLYLRPMILIDWLAESKGHFLGHIIAIIWPMNDAFTIGTL